MTPHPPHMPRRPLVAAVRELRAIASAPFAPRARPATAGLVARAGAPPVPLSATRRATRLPVPLSATRRATRPPAGVLAAGLAALFLAVAGAAPPARAQAPGPATYAAAQAERGAEVYAAQCAACHGAALEGGAAPELAGRVFRRMWSRPQTSLEDLYHVTATTMPPTAPGALAEEDYVAVVAYILERNGVPAGTEPLQADAEYMLAIRMDAVDADAPPPAPAFIQGERARPAGRGPTTTDLLASPSRAADWPYHTRDYHGTRYSPLRQIDTSNAHRLQPVCVYQVGDPGNFQTGPLVHDGVLYATGVHTTFAIDAATCRQIWRHQWRPLDRQSWLNSRGVAIQDGYVVRGTNDGYLFALDAADGTLLWARQVADPWIGETFTMAPMIYRDRILIGPAGSENAIKGWIGAFALEDGSPIWRFETVPGAGRTGGPTWGNPLGIPLGGGAVWTPLSLDHERGELYVAVTNPAPDLPAFLRPGENLYTNSIVALDVETGELRWYRQLVPNDDHDWDLTQVSPVFPGRAGSRDRNLVATAGKDGVLRLIDRDSHETVWESDVTPRFNVDAPVTTEGKWACPGILGGVQWNGPALAREARLLITPAVDWCTWFAAAEPEDVRYVPGQSYLGGTYRFAGRSAGFLTAVSVADGSVRWRYTSPRPMLAGVTTTAGGLAATGELTGDFLVLEAATGRELYRFNTGGPIGGGVITYEVDGRQYLAVASGRPSAFWIQDHPGAATVVVFALPVEGEAGGPASERIRIFDGAGPAPPSPPADPAQAAGEGASNRPVRVPLPPMFQRRG